MATEGLMIRIVDTPNSWVIIRKQHLPYLQYLTVETATEEDKRSKKWIPGAAQYQTTTSAVDAFHAKWKAQVMGRWTRNSL